MFLKSVVNETRFFLASAILLLAIPQAGPSQVTSPQVTSPQVTSPPVISDEVIETLDEVVVYGQPTLRLLRDEAYEAEEKFYEIFNALNDGRQFDVTCSYRTHVGSLIPKRVCEAYFVKSPPITSLRDRNGPPHWAYVQHKTRQMHQEMAVLVNRHPKLRAALLEFVDAKQNFDSSFRDRCANRYLICRR